MEQLSTNLSIQGAGGHITFSLAHGATSATVQAKLAGLIAGQFLAAAAQAAGSVQFQTMPGQPDYLAPLLQPHRVGTCPDQFRPTQRIALHFSFGDANVAMSLDRGTARTLLQELETLLAGSGA